jgi:septal ring-binding cell division protein DamX
MAVGAAALFLILMAQGSGDAVENTQLPADPTLQTSAATPARLVPESTYPDDADSGDDAAPPPVVSPAAAPPSPRPATDTAPRAPVSSAPEVATPPASRMLEKAGDEELGHEKMLSGDYRGAARHFGREVAGSSGAYTIQLLMACQDDTVRRAVENGRSSPEMFILSTTFQGRSCYRVYWGRYPSQKRAQEALLRDIPSAFRSERPRVTRLAGS